MASSDRKAEADLVDAAYHIALATLGARAYAETYESWLTVSPSAGRASFDVWLTGRLRALRGWRRRAKLLAWRFTRLDRALRTGWTFADGNGAAGPVRASVLRREFVDLVREVAPGALRSNRVPDFTAADGVDTSTTIDEPGGGVYPGYAASDWGDAEFAAEIADAVWEVAAGDDLAVSSAEAAVQWRRVFDAAVADLEQGAAVVGDSANGAVVVEDGGRPKVKRRKKADRAAQAARHAERMVQNAGRDVELGIAERDDRVYGWVRVHFPEGDAYPCGFCGLLLSRGPVYKSEASAVRTSHFDEFHNGCHCRARAVYDQESYFTDPAFELNRSLRELWDAEISGSYSGDEAVSVWRKLLRERAARAGSHGH